MSEFDPTHLNGIGGTSGVPLITPSVKFEFNEMTARALVAQVKKVVGAGGGNIPVSDPASVLILGVVLDKLAGIEERLSRIETPSQ